MHKDGGRGGRGGGDHHQRVDDRRNNYDGPCHDNGYAGEKPH